MESTQLLMEMEMEINCFKKKQGWHRIKLWIKLLQTMSVFLDILSWASSLQHVGR